jgi:hypothetical protein
LVEYFFFSCFRRFLLDLDVLLEVRVCNEAGFDLILKIVHRWLDKWTSTVSSVFRIWPLIQFIYRPFTRFWSDRRTKSLLVGSSDLYGMDDSTHWVSDNFMADLPICYAIQLYNKLMIYFHPKRNLKCHFWLDGTIHNFLLIAQVVD